MEIVELTVLEKGVCLMANLALGTVQRKGADGAAEAEMKEAM